MQNPPHDDKTRITSASSPDQKARGRAPGDFAVGEVIAGSYKVLSFIGRGGMGAVYRVHHLFLDKEMALKTLSGDQITEVAWKRFQIEGQAIARLDHPNIIRIYDLGIVGQNQPYYVMDLVEGISLAELICKQGALKPEFALPLFRQVSAGLAYAHERGIIHRDLKPANIMLLPNSNANSNAISNAIPIAKILDFGLAKLTDLAGGGAAGLTKTGEIFGSPLYMSPEQAQGQSIDQTTDIYSFGCSLFEALTGEPPLKGANALETMLMHQSKEAPRLSQVRPDLNFSPQLEALMVKLLAKKREQRYRSFAEIASQLLLIERPQDMSISGSGYQNAGRQSDDSTGRQSDSDSHISAEFNEPAAGALSTKPWFLPTLVAGSLVLLVMLGGGAYLMFAPKAAPPAAESKLPAVPESVKQPEVVLTSEYGTPKLSSDQHFSHIEGAGNNQVKVFEFPEKRNLGKITFDIPKSAQEILANEWQRDHGTDGRNPYNEGLAAQGKQIIPIAYKLIFQAQLDTCNTPGIFKQFRSDDLFELNISRNEYVNSDFLPYIKHLKGLHGLALDETDVDDKGIKVLESLPQLASLSIDHTRISGDALAKSSLIKRMQNLSYVSGKDISKVLQALDNSTTIKELRLDGNQLTRADLQLLTQMPNLKKLCINECGVTAADLKVIAGIKALTSLDFRDESIGPESIAALSTMHLSKLEISGKGWSAGQKASLMRAMGKDCKVSIKSEY